ncbi:hypothetical protein Hanom_Chr09g00795751 [Helianthus anomalus]
MRNGLFFVYSQVIVPILLGGVAILGCLLILWQNHTDLNIWLWSEAVVAITPIVVVVKRLVMFSSGVESTTYVHKTLVVGICWRKIGEMMMD